MPENKPMMLFRTALTAVVLLLPIGCSQIIPATQEVPSSPSSAVEQASASPIPGIATPDRLIQTPTKLPEFVPTTESGDPVTGEVPDQLLDDILRDLIEHTGAPSDKIAVVRAEAMVWNDGSLGCAQLGEFYTQAPVNGYWVIMEFEGKTYDYRATDRGYFFLCEGRFRPTPPSTPSS